MIIGINDIFSSENSGIIVRPNGTTSSESNETISGNDYILSPDCPDRMLCMKR